jgi:hypothetical protein
VTASRNCFLSSKRVSWTIDFKSQIENNKVDITEFKAQLHQENIHNLNPTLFKRVNDMARKTNFEGELTEE